MKLVYGLLALVWAVLAVLYAVDILGPSKLAIVMYCGLIAFIHAIEASR